MNVEVVELLVALLAAHAVDDASVAVYGINILEAIITYAVNKGDAIYSFLLKSLTHQKIGTLLMHIMSVYSYNELNCNVEILGRAVHLLHFMCVESASFGGKLNSKPEWGASELKVQIYQARGVELMNSAVLNNITVMERLPNEQAEAIITAITPLHTV